MSVSMVRYLAITHIVVGALLFIFGIADGVTSVLGRDEMFDNGGLFFVVWIGTWMCIAGGLGIPGSTPQRTQRRNCFAGIFMGFSITSAVLGGIIIIAYSVTIGSASYFRYYHDYDPCGCTTTVTYINQRYSYGAKMGLAAVILALGVIEFCTGLWVSICLCVMKPCCADLEENEPLANAVTG